MKHLLVAGMSSVVLLVGCAHGTMRGTVAMKVSDREGHVCLGDKEVKAGDHVAFFENRCSSGGGREGSGPNCEKIKIGDGEVVRPLNEHYSVVKSFGDVKLEEGNIVEKL